MAMIINGVDVINCKFLEMPYINSDIYCRLGLLDLKNTQEALLCKNCPNCYYKQLQFLSQKCKQLEYKVEELVHATDKIIADTTEILKPYVLDTTEIKDAE